MDCHVLRFGERAKLVPLHRLDSRTVLVSFDRVEHRFEYDARAEGYSHLVVFDGHLLRDGIPHGAKPLSYEAYGRTYRSGEFEIVLTTTSGKVKRVDPTTGLDRDRDEVTDEDGVARTRFYLHAFQFPRAKNGTRGIFMRPKPLSLEREYVRIVSTPSSVVFETCVSF